MNAPYKLSLAGLLQSESIAETSLIKLSPDSHYLATTSTKSPEKITLWDTTSLMISEEDFLQAQMNNETLTPITHHLTTNSPIAQAQFKPSNTASPTGETNPNILAAIDSAGILYLWKECLIMKKPVFRLMSRKMMESDDFGVYDRFRFDMRWVGFFEEDAFVSGSALGDDFISKKCVTSLGVKKATEFKRVEYLAVLKELRSVEICKVMHAKGYDVKLILQPFKKISVNHSTHNSQLNSDCLRLFSVNVRKFDDSRPGKGSLEVLALKERNEVAKFSIPIVGAQMLISLVRARRLCGELKTAKTRG